MAFYFFAYNPPMTIFLIEKKIQNPYHLFKFPTLQRPLALSSILLFFCPATLASLTFLQFSKDTNTSWV